MLKVVPKAARDAFSHLVAAASQKYNIKEDIIWAIMAIESAFNPAAESGKGALGLMQIMPATAAELGVDPRDPAQAIDGATRYFSQLLKRYGGNVAYALAAYNWGMGRLGLPPSTPGRWPRETQLYINRFAVVYFGTDEKAG